MAYITRNDILTRISDSQLDNFTDDLGDSAETSTNLDLILQNASDTADSFVASIYNTPFVPTPPQKIKQASLIFACEQLYVRRLTPEEKNPFKAEADNWRRLLTQIGSGQVPLDLNFPRALPAGVEITTPSILDDNLM